MRQGVKAMIENVTLYNDDCRTNWLSELSTQKYIQLSKNSSKEDVDLFLVALFANNDVNYKDSVNESFLNLLKEYKENGLICSGGIVFYDENKEILPSCCCGIEGFKQVIQEIKEEISGIWLGHDPFPVVEFAENTVTVWQDDVLGLYNQPVAKDGLVSIVYDKKELIFMLDNLTNEVHDFLSNPLAKRLAELKVTHTDSVLNMLKEWLEL